MEATNDLNYDAYLARAIAIFNDKMDAGFAEDGIILTCFITEDQEEIFEQLNQSYIAGVTFSGGDPLYWGNVADITELAKEIKEKYPKKTIWLYTGSLWESIVEMDILQYVDVLVDGEFIEEKKDVSLKWKGSSNQRVIDVQQSLKTGTVVLHA